MRILIPFFFLVFLASCSSGKKISSASKISTVIVSTVGGDGSSFKEAIIINEKSESEGIHAEYDWLALHYPGYKLQIQRLINEGKKNYDVMEIITADGQSKKIYFDISNFFGKF